MTPLELVRDECANYDQGACLGLNADSLLCRSGQRPTAHPLPKCLIQLGERCPYFEDVVLPMAAHGSPAIISALEAYRGFHAMARTRLAPGKCSSCGADRAPRKRFCLDCAREHRRTTLRDAKRRERVSTVKGKNWPANT